ncbi:cytochrome P450 [Amycolatopsis heterodermiae]
MSAAADEALLSLATPAGLADPYPVYAKLREEAPVFRSEVYDSWVVSRFADCQPLLADGTNFLVLDAQWRDEHRPGWRDNPAMVLLAELLPWKNPPEHTRERRLLMRDFTVRRVQALEPAVRRSVDRVLDRFADATADGSAAEFVGTVLYPLGMAVIGDLVGVPEADHDELRRVTDLIGRQVNPAMSADLRAEVDAAAVEYRAYFGGLIEQRRAEPRDDLTSALLAGPDAGTEDVLRSLVVLFGGGYETTAGALGIGIHALLTHPEQFALLAGDPGLAAGAAEEMLRWDGSAQMSQRAAVRPAVVGGVELPAGEAIVVLGVGRRSGQPGPRAVRRPGPLRHHPRRRPGPVLRPRPAPLPGRGPGPPGDDRPLGTDRQAVPGPGARRRGAAPPEPGAARDGRAAPDALTRATGRTAG